ncbi:MAG: NAD-dependent epimerase/dehydratase family protein [Elusimicrobiota bacterium]|nr:NAD-dependent epimerase/dehydratase family protein [Elusimicrobiota bacterium]
MTIHKAKHNCRKILVTGAAGFIGSNLTLELQRRFPDAEITAVDNFFAGRSENLKGFKGEFSNRDISKGPVLQGGYDIIFHEAAITDPRYGDDKEMVRSNVDGFKNIINLARRTGAKLIYASSASMYGNGPAPQKESQKKEILSAYAESKLAMDDMAKDLYRDMHVVGLRYFNVFGPGESHKGRPASMVYHLVRQMKKGGRPRIFKMGEQKRDHIYVKDVVEATILAADARKSGVYNVGTGTAVDFNELVADINSLLGTSLEAEYIDNPYVGTYQNHTQADTKAAEKYLGFKSRYGLKEGIRDYIENHGL